MDFRVEPKYIETVSDNSKKTLWDEIVEESDKVKNEIKAYIRSKNIESEVYPNPTVAYLDETVFPLLHGAMIEMFRKVKEDDSYILPKTTLIGIDFISEYLYNMNPKYPERQSKWTYIFDIDWVKEFLDQKPRPYFPFHLVWTKDFAALKIQAYMRGYWARRRDDVQEVRQFWKDYKDDHDKTVKYTEHHQVFVVDM